MAHGDRKVPRAACPRQYVQLILSLPQCTYSVFRFEPRSRPHFRTPSHLHRDLNAPRLPRATPLIQSFTIHMFMSHTTYDSHNGPPTLDARRLPTRICPTFAHNATQDPQTPSRLFPLRCVSSPFTIHHSPFRGRSRMHTCMNERTYVRIYDDE
jgi:hypothetical protein